jgi:hypothetical protein
LKKLEFQFFQHLLKSSRGQAIVWLLPSNAEIILSHGVVLTVGCCIMCRPDIAASLPSGESFHGARPSQPEGASRDHFRQMSGGL